MNQKYNKPWFPAKKYGFGWGFPITWQGWVVFLIYFFLCFLGGKFLTNPPYLILFFLPYLFIITGILIYICWKKGEKQKY